MEFWRRRIEVKRIKDFLSRLGSYGFLFLLILFFFGIGSGYKAMKCWINNETVNSNWVIELGSKGEVEYVSSFLGKFHFLNLNGLMRNLTGQREMNDIIKLNNGYLFMRNIYCSDEELESRAASLENLNRFLAESDTELLVAIAPDTVSKYDPQMPYGTVDYTNDNLDRLVPMLEERGINVMDIREVMYEDGLDQYTMMFKTDHHWTPRTGFYVYGKIADWIEEKTGVQVEETIRDLDNYSITTYENWHLGSRGQRTGSWFAGTDDFDLILPEFETLVTDGERTGTFEELFINMEPFEEKDITARSTYDVALRQSCGDYSNLLATNDLKILMVGDSFSDAVCCYMNISYKEMRYLWCLQSNLLTKDYLEGYDPDVVVCLYYPENLFLDGGVAFEIPYVEE